MSYNQGGAKFISPQEIARNLDVHITTVYAMIRRGELPAIRVGRLWKISADAYELFASGAALPPVDYFPDIPEEHPPLSVGGTHYTARPSYAGTIYQGDIALELDDFPDESDQEWAPSPSLAERREMETPLPAYRL